MFLRSLFSHVMPSAGRWAIEQTSERFLLYFFAVVPAAAAAAVRINCLKSIHLVNV